MIEVRSGFLSCSLYQATPPLDKNYFPRYSICMDDQTATKQKKTWTHQADNRARLIDAGYTILSEKGIEATTVKEIARLAGVSPGLFHYYFASKDELLLAVLYEAGKRFSQQLSQELQGLVMKGKTFLPCHRSSGDRKDNPGDYRHRRGSGPDYRSGGACQF